MDIQMVTAKGPVNIAVIKYWGKLDEELIIPLNDSISGTLSTDELCSTTTIAVSKGFSSDRMWLNGVEQDIKENKRLLNCINQVRSYSTVEWSKYHIHICSKNNFPTAAGLASSAAGFACLVFCLGNLFQIQDQTILSTFARIGSGSACRSLFGGFVQWIKGTDTKSSIAKQLVDSNYWPQMRVLILVVSDQQKDTSSTSGMQLTVKTSVLLKHRVESIVSKRVLDMQQAIVNRDFNKFAEITMKDSNQFHAVCQDTWPPIRYMNDVSWIIISLCHKYNDFYGTNKIAYTFDAGPNACLYLLEENVGEVMKLIKTFYPPSNEFEQQFVKGINIIEPNELSSELLDAFENQIIRSGALRYVISTKIGCGPKIVQDENLLNANGFPI